MADENAKLQEERILFANKASHLLAEKNVDEAIGICESGVKEFPFYAPGHFILGLCYDAVGKKDDAKNEFERVLVYDPSHNTAMRKLSEIYARNNLENVANQLLIREALYSPLNPEIIKILKEKNLYIHLNPVKETSEQAEQVIPADQNQLNADDVMAESQIKDDSELTVADDNDSLPAVEQQTEISEDFEKEPGFKNLDPLAGLDESENVDEEDDDLLEEESSVTASAIQKEKIAQDSEENSDAQKAVEEKEEYLNIEDETIDEDEWLEVENLLIDEEYEDLESTELDTYSSVLPQSEMLRNDTELLLEELKSADSNPPEPDSEIEFETEAVDAEKSPQSTEAETAEKNLEESPFAEDDDYTQKTSYQEQNAIDFEGEESEVTIRDLMENPNLVTPTFGEILIAQHKFSEARHVFLELQKRAPQNQRFSKKIDFLNKFLEAQNPV